MSAYIDKITEGQHTAMARARLLDGEDMDMSDDWLRHHRGDSGSGTWRGGTVPFHLPFKENMSSRSLSASIASRNTQNSATTPQLLRARGSETGSIFHEGVWPPPGEESRLVDPLTNASSHVDLSRIVDDIMGNNDEAGGYIHMPTPPSTTPPRSQSPSDFQSILMKQDGLPPPYAAHNRTDSATASHTHSRGASVTSETGLVPASPGAVPSQPRRSSPLAQGNESTTSLRFGSVGGSPSTVHWLKRSPRNHHPGLDKPAE